MWQNFDGIYLFTELKQNAHQRKTIQIIEKSFLFSNCMSQNSQSQPKTQDIFYYLQ